MERTRCLPALGTGAIEGSTHNTGAMTLGSFTIKRMVGDPLKNDVVDVRVSTGLYRAAPKNREPGTGGVEFRIEELGDKVGGVASMPRGRAMESVDGSPIGIEPPVINAARQGGRDHANSGRSSVPGNGNCRLSGEFSMPR